LAHEIEVQNAVRDLIQRGLVKSAHDCSEGGLAVALAECCFNPSGLLGAEINVAQLSELRTIEDRKLEACATLFNESQSRIIISVSPTDVDQTIALLRERHVPFHELGETGGDQLSIRAHAHSFDWAIADLHDLWWNAIRRAIESDSGAEGIPSL
jgi:phosphoribosylformylglycinamidine synthase